MGQGRYSDRLYFKDWLLFAKAQRTHYNFLEAWGSQVAFIIVGAFGYPIHSAIIGLVAIIGRLFYTYGYMNSNGYNSSWRKIGSFLCDVALLAGFILSMLVCMNIYLSKHYYSASHSEPTSSPTPGSNPSSPTSPT